MVLQLRYLAIAFAPELRQVRQASYCILIFECRARQKNGRIFSRVEIKIMKRRKEYVG